MNVIRKLRTCVRRCVRVLNVGCHIMVVSCLLLGYGTVVNAVRTILCQMRVCLREAIMYE